MRAFVRQDPDVIMVGEIRDAETANIAVHAALTGHLVLTTLHTETAAAAVPRLLDLGVEGFLLRSTLRAVVAERLVRVLCDGCKRAHRADRRPILRPIRAIGFWALRPARACISRPVASAAAVIGFRGRAGIFELLEMTDEIRPLGRRQRGFASAIDRAADPGGHDHHARRCRGKMPGRVSRRCRRCSG